MEEYLLETVRLTKQYGGVRALSDVSIQLEAGLIHALVGENGAGKSTLIRILSGIEAPTKGSLIFQGKEVRNFTPYLAHDLGISTVYQEPKQIDLMSVEENIFMGRYKRNSLGFVDYRDLTKRTQTLMNEIGISLDPKAIVKDLSVAKQQMVEILKATSFRSKLIIFDEPTASLTLEETNNLKAIIRKLKNKGCTVIYISHRLEEIFDLCDTVSVLRDGEFIGKKAVNEISSTELIRMMVGREMGSIYPKKSESHATGDVLLCAEHLCNDRVRDVSFTLHKGEILGFSGLVGAGRTEVANILFGIDPAKGSLTLDGQCIRPHSPADAIHCGIGMVPENRKAQGLVALMSVSDNATLACLQKLRKGLFLDHKKERGVVDNYVKRLRIKTPSSDQLVRNLSGGNQQKVVFAKWMSCQPKVLILDEPTQGVDVGAKAEIYAIIYDIARTGTGVIMISSEMNELIAVCDRICVMHEGRINAILDRPHFSEDTIMRYAIEEANT